MSDLTEKQQYFVEEYLIDLNATQAAIRAGYSAKSADKIGSELLGKTRVSNAISDAMAARSARTKITQDYILSNLMEVVERCLQRAPVMVREGPRMVQATDERDRHVWQFNANGANRALKQLGDHLGMWKAPESQDDDNPLLALMREINAQPCGLPKDDPYMSKRPVAQKLQSEG